MRALAPLRRALLVRLAAASLVPIAGASLVVLWYLGVRAVADIGERNLLLARAVGGRVEAFLGEPLASLSVLAEILKCMPEETPRQTVAHLDAAVAGSRLLESVYLVGRDGKVALAGVAPAQTATRGDFVGIDLSHQECVRQALASGRPAWSETSLSILSGRMTVAICVPHEGGTLLGSFDIERLQQFVLEVQQGGLVAVSIVDREGSIIAHPDPQVALRQVRVGHHGLVRDALAGRDGTARLDYLGQDAIVSATRIESTGWVALVAQPTRDGYQPVRIAGVGFGAALLVSVGAALLFAVTQARRIAAPLAELAAQAQAVTRGGYERLPALGGSQEVQALGDSFRTMTEAVRERERLLRENEEKYRLVVENAGDAIFIAQEGRVSFANRRMEALTGLSAAALRDRPWLERVHPDDREPCGRWLGARLGGEQVPPTCTFRVRPAGGGERWVQMSSVQVRWGGLPATLNFARDITDLKKLEAQALQAQKLEAVGTLAGGVAHDFNNLLQAIQGLAEVALLPGRDAAANRKTLGQIIGASERGADLTRQLLAFGRKVESRRIPIRLNAEIAQLVAMLGSTLPKMIRVEFARGELPGTVLADQGQIHQMLMNLAVNAAHAMPDGGILRIATAAAEVSAPEAASLEIAQGRYAEITVADTGFGIAEEHQARIFEPFFTTKGHGVGTGLGLSMVLGIVRAHEGHVSFTSVPGCGTTFRVLLPLSSPVPAPAGPGGGSSAPVGVAHAERILVVDDEESVRGFAAEILSAWGYRVLTAPDGETALRILREERRIALVLLDVIMPGMGGMRCLRELLQFDPGAKVIVMSGYLGDAAETTPLAAGACGFLPKPFKADALRAAVGEAFACGRRGEG